MGPDQRDEPILGRLLLVAGVVVVLLFAARLWLQPKPSGGPPVGSHPGNDRGDGPGLFGLRNDRGDDRGDGPGLFGLSPPPGRFVRETVDAAGTRVFETIDVEVDGDRVLLRMVYRPPEPDVFGPPEPLGEHLAKIPLRIELDRTGHLVDVTGPDDYFDPLDDTRPELADRLRSMEIEEQVDAVLGWQITGYMSQPAIEGARFSADARFPGLGDLPDWEGTVDYVVGPATPCGGAAGDEECLPVRFRSRAETDGHSELSGEFSIGIDTGLEWGGKLVRQSGPRTREVSRRLVRPEDVDTSP